MQLSSNNSANASTAPHNRYIIDLECVLRMEPLARWRLGSPLAEAGHLNERGQPFNPKSVRSMIRGARGS